MFEKNLKFYRLKKGLSMKELADRSGLTSMAISNYENGKRMPDMDVLKRLAAELDVRVSDFLAVRNEKLVFQHGEFRKSSTMPQKEQDYIRESVEEHFSRFYTAVELLGGEVLPEVPECHQLVITGDAEADAQALRRSLKLAESGPAGNLVEILENRGFLVIDCRIESHKFSGMNGTVNGRPYVVYNSSMSPERNRSTIAHELAHLLFQWPDHLAETEAEQYATAVSGAFLLPAEDAVRELGIHRKQITSDMQIISREYGISMFLLTKRARITGIINESAEKAFYMKASSMGWRKNEPSRIQPEMPGLFQQLVYRAVGEEEISIQKGAELLKLPYEQVRDACYFNGEQ